MKLIKMNKSKVFQISLIFIGFLIIFLTYFSNFQEKTETKKDAIQKDFLEKPLEEEINKFENVEYRGIDNNGNDFFIRSKIAEFEQEKPEIINMEEVISTFYFKDGTVLTIIADKGIFNNITNDMNFADNVKMTYLDNVLYSDKAVFNNSENQLLVSGNVDGQNSESKLKADELDFDLNTKNLKISMYNEERVNIKTKF